jgi:hypothetical protein
MMDPFAILLLYALLTTAFYYLGARAKLTQWLWSRYPKRLDTFMMCSACSGFWYGIGVGFGIGWWRELPFLGLPGRLWITSIVIGLCSMVWTPILSTVHLRAFEYTNAEPEEDDGTEEK